MNIMGNFARIVAIFTVFLANFQVVFVPKKANFLQVDSIFLAIVICQTGNLQLECRNTKVCKSILQLLTVFLAVFSAKEKVQSFLQVYAIFCKHP